MTFPADPAALAHATRVDRALAEQMLAVGDSSVGYVPELLAVRRVAPAPPHHTATDLGRSLHASRSAGCLCCAAAAGRAGTDAEGPPGSSLLLSCCRCSLRRRAVAGGPAG
jgi:hypothetical protein